MSAYPLIVVPRIDNIPEEMAQCVQWINWRWDTRDGKATKVPVDPHTGGNGSSTNAATWATLDEAMRRVRGSLGSRGLGFVFVSGVMGIDLDNVLDDDGKVASTWAESVLARLCPTYVERSPRGHGLHVYGTCAYPCTGGINRKIVCDDGRVIGAEMYGEGRYFTVTGDTDTPAPLGVWVPELIITLREEIEHLSRTHERARARAGDDGRAGEEIRARARAGDDGRAGEEIRARARAGDDASACEESLDFDYEVTTVDPLKLLEMHKKRTFREHWARVSEKGSDSERGAGIARLCQQAGWAPEEVCAALNTWCDDTGQERYHATKMRNTLAFVFASEEEDTGSTELVKPERAWIAAQLAGYGLLLDGIVQFGSDASFYHVFITGCDAPCVIESYAAFEKRQTWNQIAFNTAGAQGRPTPKSIPAKKWDDVLQLLGNFRTYEALDTGDSATQTAEWVAGLFDGTRKEFVSLQEMTLYECQTPAFYTGDGTAYLQLVALEDHLRLRGLRPSRSEVIARLKACGWNPPPKNGAMKREGHTVRKFRYWSHRTPEDML